MRFAICLFGCLVLPGCVTSSQMAAWNEQATLALHAERIELTGMSTESRVLDVVLTSKATTVPRFHGEDCADLGRNGLELKKTTVRHRFRTKPGKVSIVVPSLPSAELPASCHPKLHQIEVIEISQLGETVRTLAKVTDPEASKVALAFDHFRRSD